MLPTRRAKPTLPPFDEITKIIFAEPGAGKTTFCSQDNSAFFISTEPGQDWIQSANRFVKRWSAQDENDGESFCNIVRAIWAADKSGDLKKMGYKTAVIDIVDNLYSLCLNDVCRHKGLEYPPENDFGKTWKEVREEWEKWIKLLMEKVNVTFISHCTQDKIEITLPNKMRKEITRQVPTFRGGKAAQVLDGIVSAMGYISSGVDGKRMITFAQNVSLATKDRTGVLEAIGPIELPRVNAFQHVAKVYEAKAKELGFEVVSMWS
jgi:hypothetical protein